MTISKTKETVNKKSGEKHIKSSNEKGMFRLRCKLVALSKFIRVHDVSKMKGMVTRKKGIVTDILLAVSPVGVSWNRMVIKVSVGVFTLFFIPYTLRRISKCVCAEHKCIGG